MATEQWEVLRRDARQLENEIDLKLVSFSKLGTSLCVDRESRQNGRSESSPLLPSQDSSLTCDAMGMEIEQLLSRLSTVNDSMSNAVSNVSSSNPPSAAMLHTLQRHHDILQDYRQEFTKTRASINTYRERADLLGSVRRDINAYKTSGLNRRTELFMKENEQLRSSERLADDALGMAMSAKESLASQRRLLGAIGGHMTGLLNRFPGINNLMQRITIRKRRDSLILAGVISLCVIVLFLFS